MIVTTLLELLKSIFSVLTSAIQIPGFPDSVKEFMATALDYLISGVAFLSVYFDMNYLLILFSLIAIVDVAILSYKFAMWVVYKIPFIDIK